MSKLREGVKAWNGWHAATPLLYKNLEKADLRGMTLAGVHMVNVWLAGANLQGVDASGAQFDGAYLMDSRLEGIVLRGAQCGRADFAWARMSGADCRDAKFHRCNFTRANLTAADLREADLSAALFRRTDLSGANLRGSVLDETVFGGVDFRTVKGYEDAVHRGPSVVGLDSLMVSEGRISETFLRGVGVSDTLIEYAASLVAKPVQFYSCFISYSTVDEPLAKRLYADLQAAGVRCWFAPEDLKIGDKFRQRIDESIRVHEKLLVLLSAASIGSAWVESEVESAFETERQRGRIALFPIRLDDAVMTTEAAWASEVRRTRHIGDFRSWKDSDGYAVAFGRLLRDLRQ